MLLSLFQFPRQLKHGSTCILFQLLKKTRSQNSSMGITHRNLQKHTEKCVISWFYCIEPTPLFICQHQLLEDNWVEMLLLWWECIDFWSVMDLSIFRLIRKQSHLVEVYVSSQVMNGFLLTRPINICLNERRISICLLKLKRKQEKMKLIRMSLRSMLCKKRAKICLLIWLWLILDV